MLWSDYTSLVLEHLGVDATRRGIETLRLRAIRNSVLDLQRFIRQYRQGHSTTYQVTDLTNVGKAQTGTFTSGAKPTRMYTFSTLATDDPNIVRNKMGYTPWNSRDLMINGTLGTREYRYSIAPFGDIFMIYPPLISATTALKVIWDGFKMDFADGDTVPFPDSAAEASGYYAKWRILMDVDKNVQLADRLEKSYLGKRLELYRDANVARLADDEDEEK